MRRDEVNCGYIFNVFPWKCKIKMSLTLVANLYLSRKLLLYTSYVNAPPQP